MSNTPPPLRRKQTQDLPTDSKQSASSLSELGKTIKNRMGEIQTKPDVLERAKNFRFGEIQTRPDWMKRTKLRSAATDGQIQWIRIIPFAGEKYDADRLPSKLASTSGVIHFRFYKDDKGKIHIYAGHKDGEGLKKSLRQRVPNTDLQETNAPPTFDEQYVNRVGEIGGMLSPDGDLEAILDTLEDDTYLDLAFEERPDHEYKQPLRDFIRGGSAVTHKGARGALDAWKEVLNPFSAPASKRSSRSAKAKQEMDAEEKDQIKRVQSLLSETSNYFRVTIKIGAKRKNHVQPIFNELNSQMKLQHRLWMANQEKRKLWKNTSDGVDALWRESELAVLVALPDMTNKQMLNSVTHMKPGERTLGDDEMTHGVAVGRLIHPVKAKRLVKIPTKQFLQHFFMGGKNGSGKSSTAVQMIQSLLDEWGEQPDLAPGFTYIDPAGSTVTIILNRLLHMEQQGVHIPWEKVHYLDLTPESEFPVGLNLLYHTPVEDYATVSGSVLDVIKTAYGSDAIFTERLIENGVMTLLYDRRVEHNILGLTSVLQYPALREGIDVKDPLVQEFWDMTGDDLKPKSLDPLLNRLRPLLQRPAMRRIFGQARWTLNIRQWMDDGHIILINTLNLEPRNVGLVGGQVLSRYHVTAKTRPVDISKPHMLMIDEAHLVQIPILEKVIAEDRKFGLSLGLITQYPEQFEGLLLKSISENMGTFLTCTLGPSSANVMARFMNGAFEPSTLQGLPKNHVAAYTSINDHPFSFKVKSDYPVIYLPNGKVAVYENAEEMATAQNWAKEKAKVLAARDGAHRDEVDSEIDLYMQYLRQFRPVDEDDLRLNMRSSLKRYQPTDEEESILKAIVSLVRKGSGWEGRTSELLAALENYLTEDELENWTPKNIGLLINRASSWIAQQNIACENHHTKNGSVWTFSQK